MMDQPPSMMPQQGGPAGGGDPMQQIAAMELARQVAHPGGHSGKKGKHSKKGKRGRKR